MKNVLTTVKIHGHVIERDQYGHYKLDGKRETLANINRLVHIDKEEVQYEIEHAQTGIKEAKKEFAVNLSIWLFFPVLFFVMFVVGINMPCHNVYLSSFFIMLTGISSIVSFLFGLRWIEEAYNNMKLDISVANGFAF